MLKQTVSKSAVVLILMLMASTANKTVALESQMPTASQAILGGDPGGGGPDPTGCNGGPCLVALHLS
jgi:hypothetical protein